MFNVKVFKLKDILKYFAIVIVLILMIFIIINLISKTSKEEANSINIDFTACIDTTSELIRQTNKSDENEIKAYKSDFFEEIVKGQIGSIEDYQEEIPNEVESTKETINETQEKLNKEDSENVEVQNQEDESLNKTNLELAKTGLKTEIVTPNPIPLSSNFTYGNVKIKNDTSFELNDEIVNPNINITNKNIVIFHTHTCESYTSSDKYPYTPTGTFRTTDVNFTVARVGDELTSHLQGYGYNVIHNKNYHDYPSYNGSYNNSLKTVESILKNNQADVIIDLHRDAIGNRSDYAPSVKIGDEDVCAQIMFVIGTNEGGLWHPNWQQNLKFAVKVQAKAEEMYPGLFKPIMLTKYRYNQHTGKCANIMEVGSTGNTLEQCLNSMKYLAKVLDEVIK